MRYALIFLSLGRIAAEPGYIDPLQCRPCHLKIYDSYQQTGMARSFQKSNFVPALTDLLHHASGRRYSVVSRGSEHFFRRSLIYGDGVMEKRIDFAIGSGNHSKTFVHQDSQGRLVELPVSWYSERGGYWAMSPGYDRADHSDLRRQVSDTCLFCHNGYPSQRNGGLSNGIDCQRCHGPGEAHAAGLGKPVNPSRLDRGRQMDVCLQCHLESASRTLPDAVRRFDRTTFSYRPGEPLSDYKWFFEFTGNRDGAGDRITVNNSGYGLRKSKCFQESAGMTCTTCHDPHQVERGETAAPRFTAVCRSCHPSVHDAKTSACAGCHMQKRRTEDAVHVVMTDHVIRRYPLKGDPLAPIAEKHERQTGPIKLLHPERVSDSPESRLYLAVAQVRASANLAQDIPKLQKAIQQARPASPEPDLVLAEACQRAGRTLEAIAAYRSAIERGAKDAAPFLALGELLLTTNRVGEAIAVVEPAAKKFGTDGALWNSLSVLYARQERFDDALGAVSKALELDREDPVAWLNLGVCLHARKDKKGAEAAYRQALLLQPDFVRARDYLKLVLEDKL